MKIQLLPRSQANTPNVLASARDLCGFTNYIDLELDWAID